MFDLIIPNTAPKKVIKVLGLGLSSSSLTLLERLETRGHVEKFFLTPNAGNAIKNPPNGLLIAKAVDVLHSYWREFDAFIFVGSIAAVVRLIAPLIVSKDNDPAVLVIDAKGSWIVPLIGGHMSGADQMALDYTFIMM